MLTKESAATAADELISQQSALKREAADSRAWVSFVYSSPGLRSLRPARQAAIVEQAYATVSRRKSVIAASLAWVAILFFGWYLARPLPTVVSAFLWLGVLPIYAFKTWMTRREIRRLIAAPNHVA